MNVLVDEQSTIFLAHWRSLRRDGLPPSLEDFLDRPSTPHAPDVFILDIDGDHLRVRLQGTHLVERWGRDYSGSELYKTKSAQFRAKSFGNFRNTVNHPCGLYMVDEFMSTGRRLSHACSVLLPLRSKPGKPPMIVAYSRELEARHTDELLVTKSRSLKAWWIDVGAGMPDKPPQLPSD